MQKNKLEIYIRDLEFSRDSKELKLLARRAYKSWIEKCCAGKTGFVAVNKETDKIVGVITYDIKNYGSKKIGFASWLAVDPDFQRKGIAKQLSNKLKETVQTQCDLFVAHEINAYNSPSWLNADSFGLKYWPFHEQIICLKFYYFALVFGLPRTAPLHYLKVTHKDNLKSDYDPELSLGLLSYITISFIFLSLWSLRVYLENPDWQILLTVAASTASIFVARYLLVLLTGLCLRYPIAFKFSDIGSFYTLIITIASGLPILCGWVGNFFIRQIRFNYRNSNGKRAIALLHLPLVLAELIYYGITIHYKFFQGKERLLIWFFLMTDTIIPFYPTPVTSFSGGIR